MLKNVAAAVLATVVTFSGAQAAETKMEVPEITAKGAVLMEANSMRVIYGLNEHERLPNASTTKIMSAMLALEYPNLDEPFTVDSSAIHVEGSSMGLTEGDTVTMRALVYGMLLPSGNDAANAAAVKIDGDMPTFVKRMNERAKQLGLKDTHYVTPSGLDAKEHYSSAYDLARLTSYAFKDPEFMNICKRSTAKVSFGNPPYERWLTNHNKLLKQYQGCIGVKTGFTDTAHRCLVSAAERDGVRLICVTLNDGNDWRDHATLYDYGFANYKSVKLNTDVAGITVDVVGGQKSALHITAPEDAAASLTEDDLKNLTRTVKTPPFIYAPVKKGDKVGYIEFTASGIAVQTVPLYAAEDVAYKDVPTLWEMITGWLH